MNWRRGLVLAGIHLVIAGVSFVRDEVPYWPMINRAASHAETPPLRLAAFQEQGWPDHVCDFGIYDSGPSFFANVVSAANLPITVAIGWHSPCMPQEQRSRITNWMERVFGGNTRHAEIAADVCLCIGVFIEWMLIGGFPRIRPRHRWLEPSVLITFCAALGAVTGLTSLYEFSKLLMLAITVLWLWYFALLLWKPVHLAWQSTLPRLRRLS
jgi:hypothetical protein